VHGYVSNVILERVEIGDKSVEVLSGVRQLNALAPPLNFFGRLLNLGDDWMPFLVLQWQLINLDAHAVCQRPHAVFNGSHHVKDASGL